MPVGDRSSETSSHRINMKNNKLKENLGHYFLMFKFWQIQDLNRFHKIYIKNIANTSESVDKSVVNLFTNLRRVILKQQA
jgi:hypothetical protein